jgi:hypothetical protein
MHKALGSNIEGKKGNKYLQDLSARFGLLKLNMNREILERFSSE